MLEYIVKSRATSRWLAALLLVMVASALVCVKTVPVKAQSGRSIDLFTQKGGTGANQPSDMFQPQELVILYASVTYNDNPVALKDVAFQADGPPNAFANVTGTGAARTNESGMAEWSFRIPWPSENPERKIFGEWHILARVDIADQYVEDTVTFRVGWIVEITNITTLNAELNLENSYVRQSTVIFNLTVENSARTAKSATITIDVQDSASHPVIHLQLDNLVLQPGVNYVDASGVIPSDAALGVATVYAAAYTAPIEQGGILYSPGISTTFEIIAAPEQPHDVAIMNIVVFPSVAYVGDDIEITVEAANMGDYTETFSVTVYYDDSVIFAREIPSLLSNHTATIDSTWHTLDMRAGTYRLKAEATVVPGEVNTVNNVLTDGQVTLLSGPPEPSQIYRLVYPLILVFLFLIIVASLALAMFLVALFVRRRRKKPARHSYAVIVHPHI